MSSRSREKIALAVFAALVAFSICVLGWYLLAGHSWNVAASNIDDTFGSMEGYTTIVYAGTVDAEADVEADAASDGKAKAVAEEDLADPGLDAAAASASEGLKGSAAALGDGAVDAFSAAESAARQNGSALSEDVEKGSTASKKEPLDVAAVQSSYEEKGATVFALDTADPSRYEEGVIFKKGGHRFGVFSVGGPMSERALKKQVAYFTDQKVDFVVAIASDKSYVENVEDIDIVISTQDEDLFVMGETVRGTFYVDAPSVGNVGVILISPSNVVSAKVIEEL